MDNNADQLSLDALLRFIASYVVEHFKKTGRRTDGAVLADAIRTEFPQFRYAQVGVERLSDAVHVAEQRGLVIRHRDVKHLELSPGPNSDLPTGVSTESGARFRHVRPEIWRAFVFVSRGHVCFLDRTSGQVLSIRESDDSRIKSLDSDGQYVRISPIPADAQQDWMEQFTRNRESLNVDDAPIREADWWVRFSVWLRRIDAGLEREWNRFRTSKVIEFLREWSCANNVPLSNLLSPEEPIRQAIEIRNSGTVSGRTPSDSERLRDAILAAIREMPLEQLEEIAIPIRYVLRHFKPR